MKNVRKINAPEITPFDILHRDDGSGLPKHIRLTNVLVDALQYGVWKVGEKLHSEEEIVALTHYSLGTVQRALRTLAERGLIVRQNGLGSFVTAPHIKYREHRHC